MNIFEEKTDSELLSYFSDYQKLCSLDKYLYTFPKSVGKLLNTSDDFFSLHEA